MAKITQSVSRRWKNIQSFFGWEDIIAFGFIIMGILGYFTGPIPYIDHLTAFYLDIRSDLIGIGITVLFIDNVNEMYRRRAEKKRLILQMGSPNNAFAVEAVRQLYARGWADDGTLKHAALVSADLSNALLANANLENSSLYRAKLTNTIFYNAILDNADLRGSDLRNSDLSHANLRNANLRESNLEGVKAQLAHLEETNLESAILRNADLSNSFLKNADLSKADFYEANLTNANLSGVRLKGSNLNKSTLLHAIVDDEQLAEASILSDAIMPDGTIFNASTHLKITSIRKKSGLE